MKKLFGGGDAGDAPSTSAPDRSAAVEYKGFRIIPAPRPNGGQFLTAAVIEMETSEGVRTHQLIRADTHSSVDDAKSFAIQKAQQVIDEQGERLFGPAPPRPTA